MTKRRNPSSTTPVVVVGQSSPRPSAYIQQSAGFGSANTLLWLAVLAGAGVAGWYIYNHYFKDGDGAPPKPNTPTITSVSPNIANRGESLSVIITGTNFTGATEVFFGIGINVNSFTVDSSTQITAGISVSVAATPGMRSVKVTTPVSTATLSNGFGIDQIPTTVTSVNPTEGRQGETLQNVNVWGSGLSNVSSVSFGFGIPVTNVSIYSDYSITCNISITGTATPGARNISVTTPKGTFQGTNLFTVVSNASSITSISPISGRLGQDLGITIYGTDFDTATAVSLGSGIVLYPVYGGNFLISMDGTQITATIGISRTATPGVRDVSVTSPSGTGKLVGGFTVTGPKWKAGETLKWWAYEIEFTGTISSVDWDDIYSDWHYIFIGNVYPILERQLIEWYAVKV